MKHLTIGVAGGTGSGKTTVANRILELVGAERIAYLPHDSYYKDLSHLPLNLRKQRNFDHPDSLDNDLFARHIQALREGRLVEVPLYDFTTHTRRKETRTVYPSRVLLVEGILLLALPEIRKLLDVKIFVDTDADIRFIRRLKRDIHERGRTVDSVIEQYLSTVRPMHLEFVEPSKRYADVIIPEGGFNTVALEMVVARIQEMLKE